MDKLLIKGGSPLNGTIYASGAKNSALPILVSIFVCKVELETFNSTVLTLVSMFVWSAELEAFNCVILALVSTFVCSAELEVFN